MAELNLNGIPKVNSPRHTIEIVLPDGRVYTGRRGAPLADLLRMLPEWDNPEAEVGWVVSSALPGDAGNIILYGHNNIHSSVFLRLSEMQPGDEIALTTGEGEWRYRVKEVRILEIGGEEADQRAYQQYLQPGEEALLTLLSCWPPDNNTHRVIVKALPESDAPNR